MSLSASNASQASTNALIIAAAVERVERIRFVPAGVPVVTNEVDGPRLPSRCSSLNDPPEPVARVGRMARRCRVSVKAERQQLTVGAT